MRSEEALVRETLLSKESEKNLLKGVGLLGWQLFASWPLLVATAGLLTPAAAARKVQ